MKRLFSAGLAVAALSAIANSPAYALNERFDDAYRSNLNKDMLIAIRTASEAKLSERHQDSFNQGLYRLSDRFMDSYRDNLNKGLSSEANLSDRHQDEFIDGLNR